jgi:hypothetical protein
MKNEVLRSLVYYRNKDLHDLCGWPFRTVEYMRSRVAGHVTTIGRDWGETRSAYRILVRKPFGTSSVGRPRRRGEV